MGGGVLVIGESLIDIVTGTDGRTAEVVGGSPANVALGLARQRIPVRLLTALARDERGERIGAHLEGEGVDIDPASWSAPATSTAHARIGADGSAAYDFDIAWTLERPVALGDATHVHVGSIGAFVEPGATAVEAALRERRPGTVVTFDPNIRPALVPAHAQTRARFERLVSMSNLVKLSDEDAEWLYPALTPRQVCTHLVELGAGVAALTAGGSGAILQSSRAVVDVGAPRVAVRDTVGAGDTFMAALIRRVISSPELLDAATEADLLAAGSYAATAAAITVQRAGADLPTLDEILEAAAAPLAS
ncbi:PfkB family carbohydrate kinase [Microbacterium flavum]|uniref:Carbohydrate kinase n=1 Tax=Microbacterium flavum TaxID=415216 RepID=A0ABS5XUF9_9MICO|nr:PfkB family carbohydrate kinase [Microbacterium flavum]MBT8798061.1 carbohydrate kinase [Microbacterium flavum]